jgi:hypothetical protein
MDDNTEGWKSMLERIRRHNQTFEEQLGLVKAENIPATANEALLAPIKAYAKYVVQPMAMYYAVLNCDRELEGLLKELMQECGISEDNVPAESKFQALKGLMLRYGTVQLDASKISDYGVRLDEAMKQFNVCLILLWSPISVYSTACCRRR